MRQVGPQRDRDGEVVQRGVEVTGTERGEPEAELRVVVGGILVDDRAEARPRTRRSDGRRTGRERVPRARCALGFGGDGPEQQFDRTGGVAAVVRARERVRYQS